MMIFLKKLMNTNKELKIIIILYNSSDLIFRCLKELNNFKIIIFDNGNNEHIIKRIKSYSNIEKIISINKNIGFGNAVNFAFKEVDTKFFLLLNPDIILDESSILKLLKTSKENKNCAISAPYIPTDNDGYGIFPEKGKNLERTFDQKKCSKNLENIKPDSEFCVDVSKGCALLINSHHFESVGMFDKRYFLFWEEIDLCRKFREKKLSVIVNPSAIANHENGNSSKNDLKTFITKTYHSELSPLIYFKVKKFTFNIYWKIIKYIFRSITYLMIFNYKKSSKNFLKFLANINYIILK